MNGCPIKLWQEFVNITLSRKSSEHLLRLGPNGYVWQPKTHVLGQCRLVQKNNEEMHTKLAVDTSLSLCLVIKLDMIINERDDKIQKRHHYTRENTKVAHQEEIVMASAQKCLITQSHLAHGDVETDTVSSVSFRPQKSLPERLTVKDCSPGRSSIEYRLRPTG